MALKIKMDGNSRLAKQVRFFNEANKLADRLEAQQRIRFVRSCVKNENGRTDAVGRVLENLGADLARGTVLPQTAVADYLGVTAERIPSRVYDTLADVSAVNDDPGLPASTRRVALANALRVLGRAVKNARIGLEGHIA